MSGCKCSIEAYDYSEHCDFCSIKMVTARKEHKCSECGSIIKPREKYERAAGKWNGEGIMTSLTCAPCAEIRSCFFCSWIYGNLWEDLKDNIDDINLNNLDSISKEARDKFFEVIDLHELEE